MKAGKRILAGILSAVLVLSSTQLPANIACAEELPVLQEIIEGEESAEQEDASEPQQSQEDSEFVPDSGKETSEEESAEQPEQEIQGDGSDEDQYQPGTETPAESETVSENNLQISANDLMSAGETEVWADAEIVGAYQFGGAPSEDGGIAAYSESAYTDEETMNYLYQQMKGRVTSIDVSQYDIPYEKRETEEEKKIPTKLQLLVSGVLNEHPDLYYVGGRYSFGHNTVKIMSLVFTYDSTLDDAKWQSGVNAALTAVSTDMTDLQKAIVLHDYLTVNCEYDKENLDKGTVPNVSHSTYGVFANRTAVCDGYALSYKYLLQQVGIDCYMVTSEEINHAWNLIKLDGEYYQVDVTWDDPTWDLVGRSVHTYMFRSDDNFDPAGASQKHRGGRVTYGSQTVDYQATDTRYDDAFWVNSRSPLVISGDDCYYISPDGGQSGKPALMKTSLNDITSNGTALQGIDRWTAWNSTGYYGGAYSGLFRINDRLYYNDKTSIYSTAMDGTDKKTEFTADTTNGYIYGSAYYGGAVRYSIHQTPSLSERETVLVADIEVGGTEPAPPIEGPKGWNLDNLSAQYTALDDTTISSAAEGKPKLLIFYSNTCPNCQNTIRGISGRIANFAGIDIYAIETTEKSKDEVAAYQQEYGCEEITFSYDAQSGNSNSMWEYVRAAGFGNSASWPVICYIDADNNLQFVTMSLISADQVLLNLKEYCDFSPSGMEFYKITYVLNGGTNDSANPSVYTSETEKFYLWDASREGYQFGGWYEDASFTQRVRWVEKGTTGDLTFYAKWTQAATDISIRRPVKTTYRVGDRLDVTGGTVTCPDNGAAVTVDMTEKMVSGFDSSVPGICEVTVVVGDYTASFDTLIVEEPELTGVYGQQLSTVLLPQNDHGTYSWQDGTQVMDQLGGQSFSAVFTPKDSEKFQVLTDLQITVNVQNTQGDIFEVTLKRNTFVYNGEEQRPKAVVTAQDPAFPEERIVLTEGQDYEMSYENNRNAGAATAIVTGINSYGGTIRKSFEIQPATVRIQATDKTILVGDAIPASGEYEYEISGLVGTDELLVKPAFSCEIENTAVPGRYDVVPSGADAGANYTIHYENGTLTVAREYVSWTVTFDVQGHGTAPEAQMGVIAGDTAERPEDPAADGYRFDGWYRDSACTKAWDFDADIVQADMTLYAKWLEKSKGEDGFAFQEIADVYYTGKACKPLVTVYDGDTLLKSGRDYQIKYFNNTNANKDGVLKRGNGEGVNFNPALPYVEIIGKGNYTDRIKDGNADTVKVNFNILRASIGYGTEKPAAGVTLKVSEQLVTAKKVQKPFSSIKYVKGMKRDVDFRLRLTVEDACDQSGKSLSQGLELSNAEIPANYEGAFLLEVEGVGNYTGNICRTIYVADKTHLIKNAKITIGKNLKNVPFTGGTIKLTPSETNSPDTFTVKY
ncbi:MAG: InlB B-repeat-containing protein [Lachnospiraceae bacterium]|nr:InlB B-repeat-containing protein [Lachnospiraceae bacterium]